MRRCSVRLHGLVAEERLKTFVPPERIRLQIPVPNGIVRGACNQLETLVAFAQRHFSFASVGDFEL